jgi:transcriptional regulator with XRE-family HTH domain
MEGQHGSSCGRRIAEQIQRINGTKSQAALEIHRHCGVTLLRAHRVAYGYTLIEVTDRLKTILRERGADADGLAHQTVSRWETGVDTPTARYFDALCFLYRTRPDRLGYGHDYSEEEAPEPRSEALDTINVVGPEIFEVLHAAGMGARLNGNTARKAVEFFERRAEQSGYDLYTSTPLDFVPARMIDIASIQKILLQRQPASLEMRLYRALAKNAGFIGVRLTDVASVQETFNWFGVARQAARRGQDAGIEAWIAGHLCDAHACYSHSLRQGLGAARVAQLANGERPNSAALFGFLSEAGVQARLGNRRETLDAVRKAERIFDALPDDMIAADGIRIPEYFLRWHQSNALSIVGEGRLAGPLRERAMTLSFGSGDLVGRSLLCLDQAALMFSAGELDGACHHVRQAFDVPAEFHIGQIPTRTKTIMQGLASSQVGTAEVRTLVEFLRSLNGPETYPA